jgi:hypothetical protein
VPDRLGKDGDAARSGPGLARRLAGTFPRHGDERRPVYGGSRLFQEDPHWRDLILFCQYFHRDNGAGLGASHQAGWTGLVARLLQSLAQFDADAVLEDRHWLMARPYRRLAAAPIPGVTTAREARGATAPHSLPWSTTGDAGPTSEHRYLHVAPGGSRNGLLRNRPRARR